MKEKQSELKPCPFCGNDDINKEYGESGGNKGYIIYCFCCDVEQFTCCDEDAYGEHESTEKWNERSL